MGKGFLLIFGAGAALLVLVILNRTTAGNLAITAGEAAAGLVVDTASGAVIGIGKAVGVPETNMDECDRAIAEGRTWDASFACPASRFIKHVLN